LGVGPKTPETLWSPSPPVDPALHTALFSFFFSQASSFPVQDFFCLLTSYSVSFSTKSCVTFHFSFFCDNYNITSSQSPSLPTGYKAALYPP
jgi:hypothetical protein